MIAARDGLESPSTNPQAHLAHPQGLQAGANLAREPHNPMSNGSHRRGTHLGVPPGRRCHREEPAWTTTGNAILRASAGGALVATPKAGEDAPSGWVSPRGRRRSATPTVHVQDPDWVRYPGQVVGLFRKICPKNTGAWCRLAAGQSTVRCAREHGCQVQL